ncbi:MAG: DUF2723 domain-containing protein [Armatimonadota bacterium]
MKEKISNLYFNIIASVSFLLPLIIYTFTLCPVSYAEDCGEFITGAYTLGIVHPPGYPLYCILGKVFTFIPYGSIAWRVNFMSAFWAALAAFFLFLLVFRLTRKIEISFLSAMLFCFSPVFWSQAVVAEVYTLNIFFLSVCMYLLQVWRESDKNKFLYLFAFMYGLSLTNHHFMAIAAPFFLIFIIWTKWRILKDLKLVLGCIGLFIVGLLPYLYLPIASKFNPVMDWGNPETLERFLAHIQRKTYSDVGIGSYGIDVKLKFVKAFLSGFLDQFGIVFIVIGVLGFLRLVVKDIKFLVLSLGIIIFNGFVIAVTQEYPYSLLRVVTMSVYYFPCYFVFACYIGYGLSYIWDLLGKVIDKNRVLKFIISVIILLIAVIPIWHNYHENDLSRNYVAYDYAKSVLDLTDKGAILFSKGDSIVFNLLYLQQVEGYRGDVKMYEDTGCVSGDIFGKDFAFSKLSEEQRDVIRRVAYNRIIDENYNKCPIYFSYNFNLGRNSKYYLQPYGIVFRVVRKGFGWKPPFMPEDKMKLRNLNDDSIYKDYDTVSLLDFYWDTLVFYYYSISDTENLIKAAEQVYKYDDYKALSNAGGVPFKRG